MATVYVTMGVAGAYSPKAPLPIWAGAARTETITSSGTAASGSLEGGVNEVAKIYCDTAVIASVQGAASASVGVFVPGGLPEYIAIPAGATVSVIDA